jgi:hypothetical protein
MPHLPWKSREDAPAISDASLAALLAGAEVPVGSAPEVWPLAQAMAELTGRPADEELLGEAETLAAFRNQAGAPRAARRAPARKRPLSSRRVPVRAAAAVAAMALGLGGIATAAYAGALPTGLQRLAHDIIGAPAPAARPAARPPGASPAATSGPAYALCTAWAGAKAHGTREREAAAFARLATAAGGPGNVARYCATAPRPRASASPRSHPSPTPRGQGKPTTHPSPHGSGKPSGLPTPHGSGKPTAHPSPHGSGKPTALPTPHGSGKPTAHPTGKPAGQS